MRSRLKSLVRWTLFALCFMLGIVGLALPLVPQVPFFIAAFVVIAPESPWVRRKYFALRARWPGAFHSLERWRRSRRKRRQDRILEREGRRAARAARAQRAAQSQRTVRIDPGIQSLAGPGPKGLPDPRKPSGRRSFEAR